MADADVGKLFIGGIPRETTEETLKEYFSKYGVVSSSVIAKDKLTHIPRGFGFVTFFNPSDVDPVLRDCHVINGRTVEVKKAIPRNTHQQQSYRSYSPQRGTTDLGSSSNGSYRPNNSDQNSRTKKIFVGGLSSDLTEEEFKSYFEQFGMITDVVVMYDHNTNRPRGFGFITFDSEQVVETVMEKTHHELAGKRVDVKRAIPRNNGNGSRYDGGRFYKEENGYHSRGPRYEGYGYSNYPGFYYNGVYNGGFPFGGYVFYGYGGPMVVPLGPWNGFGAMGARSMAYGTGFYPSSNGNSGVPMMGMANPYDGFMNGKSSQDYNGNDNNNGPTKDAAVEKSGERSDADAQVKVDTVSESN